MSIFGKKEHKENVAERHAEADTVSQNVSEPLAKKHQSRFLMNPQQLARTQDAVRLAETKLANVEESLDRLRKQQEWLRRYNELCVALNHEKPRLYEYNKQLSSMLEEDRALERYDTFEAIQVSFLRMQILEKAASETKRGQSLLEREGEKLMLKWDEQQKRQQQSREKRAAAEQQLFLLGDRIFEGNRLEGYVDALQEDAHYLNKSIKEVEAMLATLDEELAERRENIDMQNQEMERHRAGRQSMEVHENMLEHGEVALQLLDRLAEIEDMQSQLKIRQKKVALQQDDENELLGRIFKDYQKVCTEIDALGTELATHRSSIQGQQSYTLQERTMSLKNRKQMLLSAQSLWKRISTGYVMIETKTQLLNSLRLQIEQGEAQVAKLENEVAQLERLCQEKKYTYMLSKSQSVIQLRADLKEGVSCSVCGATNHPYHSDTMLEQSMLIGEFKTESELLEAELKNKREQLRDFTLELASNKGIRQSEEENLGSVRRRQAEDVNEWRIFVSLDSSFQECSPSTNLEARQTLLRMLIENTANEAEMAQKELDTFNYHQGCIYDLSEKLQEKELRKNELSVRLNEVNTGCQVMAGQTERIQQQIDLETKLYREVYEKLEKLLTVAEWMKEWKQSREGLKGRIQNLMAGWQTINRKIMEEQAELKEERTRLDDGMAQRALMAQWLESLTKRLEWSKRTAEEKMNLHLRLVGEEEALKVYRMYDSKVREARTAEEREREATLRMQREVDQIKGRNENYKQNSENLSVQCAQERNNLDSWIRNFNASHAPVQYAELERVFGEEKDWNALRRTLQQIKIDTAICQDRVDNLNSQLVSLQAEGGRGAVNEADMLLSIVSQHETLEGKRRNIMMEIAKLTLALEEHEKAAHPVSFSDV